MTKALEAIPAAAKLLLGWTRRKKAGLKRPAGQGWADGGVGQEWPILPKQRFSQPGVPDFVSRA